MIIINKNKQMKKLKIKPSKEVIRPTKYVIKPEEK